MRKEMNDSAHTRLGRGPLVFLLLVMATLATEVRADSIRLTWRAPSDRGGDAVTSYDIRYDTIPITEGTWGLATQAPVVRASQSPGSTEVAELSGLTAGTLYYFAVKVADAVGNWSALSNSVTYVIGPSNAPSAIHPFPNPFRIGEVTEVTFTGAPSDLIILTLSGEVVRHWTNSAGMEIRWDGRNASGQFVSSGNYLWYANGGALKGIVQVIR